MFSTDPKWRPLMWYFSFGNKKKSHGLRSGEYGGCGITGLPFLAVSSYVLSHVMLQDERSCVVGKKVKVTLVQALRLCTGRTTHRGSRGMALPFHDRGTRKEWGVSVTLRPRFYPRKRPGTHFTGGRVGPRAGLERCGKSRLHRDSILGSSSP